MKRLLTWILPGLCLMAGLVAQGHPVGHQVGGLVAAFHPTARWDAEPAPVEVKLVLEIAERGEVTILLATKQAPKATAHIIALAKSGFYDNQKFFKVVNSPRPYLVQAGDPASKTEPMTSDKLGQGGSGTTVPFEESDARYDTGAVVLATINGNRDSGDSQFFILLGDYNRLLKGSGTIIGQVSQGMDVVNRIQLGDKIKSAKIVNG